MPREKDCVSVGNKIQKQKHLVLCNLHEMHAAFKKKIQMLSWDFPNSVPCSQHGVYLLGQRELTQFVLDSMHQNAVLLIDAID